MHVSKSHSTSAWQKKKEKIQSKRKCIGNTYHEMMDAMCQLWLLWTQTTECGTVLVMPVKTPPVLSLYSLCPCEALEERKCRCVVSVSTHHQYEAPWAKRLKPSALLSPPIHSAFCSVSPAFSLVFLLLHNAVRFPPLIVNCALFSFSSVA